MWKKVGTNPPYWQNTMNKKFFVSIGQNPSTGKYDSWIQKNERVTKWLSRDVSRAKAFKLAKNYMRKKLRKVV
jgi:hypothetical protein